jgi:hypothetical protein
MSNQNAFEPETTTTTDPEPQPEGLRSAYAAAYERRLPEILAIKEEQLVFLNLDTQAAVSTTIGALPEILALADRMAAMPELDHGLVTGLLDYAHAAGEAQGRYLAAITPQEDIVALNEKALRIRDILKADAMALAMRDLLDMSHFEPFKGLKGYRNTGFELIGWASVMQTAWPRIGSKTALTLEEVLNAKVVGERLVAAAGLREQGAGGGGGSRAHPASGPLASREGLRGGAPRHQLPALVPGRRRHDRADAVLPRRQAWRALRTGNRGAARDARHRREPRAGHHRNAGHDAARRTPREPHPPGHARRVSVPNDLNRHP